MSQGGIWGVGRAGRLSAARLFFLRSRLLQACAGGWPCCCCPATVALPALLPACTPTSAHQQCPNTPHHPALPLPTSAKQAELVIGNIVRRVMHIIREEMEVEQEEQDDDLMAGAGGSGLGGSGGGSGDSVGGLSRAFRPPFAAPSTRTLSLHNLLDQGAMDDAVAAVQQQQRGSGSGSRGHTPGSSPPPPLALQRSSDSMGGSGSARRSSFEQERDRRGGKAQQWDRKQEVNLFQGWCGCGSRVGL